MRLVCVSVAVNPAKGMHQNLLKIPFAIQLSCVRIRRGYQNNQRKAFIKEFRFSKLIHRHIQKQPIMYSPLLNRISTAWK